MNDLVAVAEGDLRPTLEDYPLAPFVARRAMWAANYFVLWPLGLTLTVDVDRQRPLSAEPTNLRVSAWVYPVGELAETINQPQDDNNAAFREFLSFVHERFVGMKEEERRALMKSYGDRNIASPEQVLLAAAP